MENIDDKQYVFVIDDYSRYDSDEVVEIFNINSRWWAIKKVQLDFGRPILSNIEKSEDESLYYHFYDTVDEARAFLKSLKRCEGMRL